MYSAQGMTLSTCCTAAVDISCAMAQKRKLLGQGCTDTGTGTGGQKQGQKNRERATANHAIHTVNHDQLLHFWIV